MAGYESGPRVGLEVAARPVASTVTPANNSAEIDSFVKGLSSLNSALQEDFQYTRKQDLEAGHTAATNQEALPNGSNRSFTEGYLTGQGQAAAIKDAAELKQKILVEAPDNPQLAQQMTKDFYDSKMQGNTIPDYAKGYKAVFAKESMQLQAAVNENSAKQVVAANDEAASTRIQYAISTTSGSLTPANVRSVVHDQINQIAADHHLTNQRKEQLTILALQELAAAGNKEALDLILHSDRTDSKTGGIFPSLASNPNNLGHVNALKNQAKAVDLNIRKQELDDKITPFYRAASDGMLDPAGWKALTEDPRYKDLLSAPTIVGIENANKAAIHRKEAEAAVLARMAESAKQRDLVNTAAGTAMASGRADLLTPQQIAAPSGNGSTTISVDDQVEAGRQIWVKANPDATPTQVIQFASNNVMPNGKTVAMPELLNPLRFLTGAGIASAKSAVDPKTGEKLPLAVRDLDPRSMQALQMYRAIPVDQRGYLKEHMGEAKMEILDNLDIGINAGLTPVEAASYAQDIATGGVTIEDKTKFRKAVQAASDDAVSGGFAKWIPFNDVTSGKGNVTAVRERTKSVATLLMMSGRFTEPEDAVAEATKILAPQVFTTSGSAFFKGDLPALPKTFSGHEQGMRILFKDAVKNQQDKTLGDSDLTADYYKGQWFIKRRDGRTPVYTENGDQLIYTNSQIASLWKNADQSIVEATKTESKRKEAETKSAAEARAKLDKQQPWNIARGLR